MPGIRVFSVRISVQVTKTESAGKDDPLPENPMRRSTSISAGDIRQSYNVRRAANRSVGRAPLCFLIALALAALLLPRTMRGLQMPDAGPQQLPDLPHVRGTVKSIHGSDATIQTEEGRTYTIHTSDNTRIYKNRQPLKMSDIHPGDMLIAAGELDGKSGLLRAIFVADIDAATVQKLRAELGKTWIAGKVVKIDETKITVERIDRKTQVIEVDETTSFFKHGQSVTLLDIHVGDGVRGKGMVKNGIFVPTQLTVVDAAARRRVGALFPSEQK
jgi:hypothetical protein